MHAPHHKRSFSPPSHTDRNGSLLPVGQLPEFVILGIQKCGTNGLGAVLHDLGGVHESARGKALEDKRQSYHGEVNWPCSKNKWLDPDNIKIYASHFPSVGRAIDKSTGYFNERCAPLLYQALPANAKVLASLCDPVKQIWSLMNQLRIERYGQTKAAYEYNRRNCVPAVLKEAVLTALNGSQTSCEVLFGGGLDTCRRQICHTVASWRNVGSAFKAYDSLFGKRFAVFITEHAGAQPAAYAQAVANLTGPWQRIVLPARKVYSHASSRAYIPYRQPAERGEWFDVLTQTLRPMLSQLRIAISMHYGVDIRKYWQPALFTAIT